METYRICPICEKETAFRRTNLTECFGIDEHMQIYVCTICRHEMLVKE